MHSLRNPSSKVFSSLPISSRFLSNSSPKQVQPTARTSFSSSPLISASSFPKPWTNPSIRTISMSASASTSALSSDCIPCKSSSVQPLTEEEHSTNFNSLSKGWELSTDSTSSNQPSDKDPIKVLAKTYKFRNWKFAQKFTEKIGEISEQQGHHPTIILTWGQVKVEWWTHTVKGIHTNDYIMAIKTDEIASQSEGIKLPKVETK